MKANPSVHMFDVIVVGSGMGGMTIVPDAGHLWVLVHMNEVLDDMKHTMERTR
jgi:cation diffusion facilitator CzcD-associated flavoprotein CzcO